jgi:hypothetical protein
MMGHHAFFVDRCHAQGEDVVLIGSMFLRLDCRVCQGYFKGLAPSFLLRYPSVDTFGEVLSL